MIRQGLTLLFGIMLAVGGIGGVGYHFLYGPDTGAPFNPFAGVIMLKFVLTHPVSLILFALAGGGGVGLAAVAKKE